MHDIMFIPVHVNRGRKFRGFGYRVKGGYNYERGWSGSGVDPYQCVEYVKIWNPSTKSFAYSNSKYIEDAIIDSEQRLSDLKIYIDYMISEKIAHCRRIASSEDEALKWARNSLLKYNPELKDEIDIVLPDKRDVADEVEKTLRWAMNLKTKPCTIYGKYCPGGRPIPETKKVRKAYKALLDRGLTKLEGFNETWNFFTGLFNMKVPKDIQKLVENGIKQNI